MEGKQCPFFTASMPYNQTNRFRHYVAFIRKKLPSENEEAWVLFNDEKVVKAVDVDEMKKFAYVYFFRHV